MRNLAYILPLRFYNFEKKQRILHCVREKIYQQFFCNIIYKAQAILMKFGT